MVLTRLVMANFLFVFFSKDNFLFVGLSRNTAQGKEAKRAGSAHYCYRHDAFHISFQLGGRAARKRCAAATTQLLLY